ncbi:hypothetical protein BDW60DRAFT_137245 [Aspergillus nidulans var. acristatus]
MDQTAPSSILWATQLRQENIHLVNKMDQINGILTSAMGTIETLNSIIDMQGERIERLEKQRGLDKEQLTGTVRESNAKSQNLEGHSCKDNEERFKEVSERTRTLDQANFELTTKVNVASDKLVALQTENATLRDEVAEARQKLRILETDNAALKEQIGRVVERFGVFETESRPLKQDLVSVLQTFETTQSGNAELKQRVCVLEKELSVQEKRVTKVLNWMSLKTMGRDTDKRATSARPRPTPTQTDTDQDGGQEMRIPDSIPTPTSRHSTLDRTAHRNLSETTWGSLTDLDTTWTPERARNPVSSPQKDADEQKTHARIRQAGRSLKGYFQFTDSIRRRSCPQIPEEALIRAFINGLEDEDTKKRVREIASHTKLSWKSIASHVEQVILEHEQGQENEKQAHGKVAQIPMKRDAAGLGRGSLENRRENKLRRSIPIVPPDEEDDMFAS